MNRRTKKKNFISRIMVPTDFSDCSATALKYAVALAKPLKAHLILVHVIEPSYHAGKGLSFLHGRERLLDDLSKEVLKKKVPVDVRLAHGAPLGEIIHSANGRRLI